MGGVGMTKLLLLYAYALLLFLSGIGVRRLLLSSHLPAAARNTQIRAARAKNTTAHSRAGNGVAATDQSTRTTKARDGPGSGSSQPRLPSSQLPLPALEQMRGRPQKPVASGKSRPVRHTERCRVLEVLQVRETSPDANARYRRTRLVRADFEYPLLRIDELVSADPATSQESVLETRILVADHVMVKLANNASGADLEALNKLHNANVRKKMLAPRAYLVSFQDVDLDTVDNAVRLYTEASQVVAVAERDYVASAEDIFADGPGF